MGTAPLADGASPTEASPFIVSELLEGATLHQVLKRLAGLILHAALSPPAIALHRLITAESARFPELARAAHAQDASQEAIRLIFARFRELGSARQVLLSMTVDQVHFPRPSDGKKLVAFECQKAGTSQRSAVLSQRSFTINDVSTLFLARAIAIRRESTWGA